jgi:hypothetical protein
MLFLPIENGAIFKMIEILNFRHFSPAASGIRHLYFRIWIGATAPQARFRWSIN